MKTIQLREEQLTVAKTTVPLGKAHIYKRTVTEEQTITVPVQREELIIETTEPNKGTETICIPLSEEQISIQTKKVPLEDVTVYTDRIESIEHIEETVKKEVLHISRTGDAIIVDAPHSSQ